MNERRKFTRKNLHLVGYLLREDGELAFSIQDLSLGGIRVHFEADPGLAAGEQVVTRMPHLLLEGYSLLTLWTRPSDEGGFLVGFEFGVAESPAGEIRCLYWDEASGSWSPA
ncbi:MAG TPA: PilZ domain-containing protein [Methylococcaceae bacterium]|nr:PilZ domain-containing protein [Methylococcaceae bacterium]